LCGVVVGGDGRLVVIGEDAADEVGGISAIAAVHEVGAAGFLVAVFAVASGALVEGWDHMILPGTRLRTITRILYLHVCEAKMNTTLFMQ
jgi:hypothetical protein